MEPIASHGRLRGGRYSHQEAQLTELEYYRIAHEAMCKAVAEVCQPDDLAAIFARCADFTAVALADYRNDPAEEALDQAEDIARAAADENVEKTNEEEFSVEDDPDPTDPKAFVKKYLEENPGPARQPRRRNGDPL